MSPQRPIFDFSARTYFVISQFEIVLLHISLELQDKHFILYYLWLTYRLHFDSDQMMKCLEFFFWIGMSSQQQCGQAISLSIIIWLGWGMINCNPGGILGTLLFEVSRFAKNGCNSTLMFTWIIPTPMCLGW